MNVMKSCIFVLYLLSLFQFSVCSICKGFATLTCSGACACTPSTQLSSGIISDGPGVYGPWWNCQWIIFSESRMSLQITEFDTQGTRDWLHIYRCTTPTCEIRQELFVRISGMVKSNSPVFRRVEYNDPAYPYLQVIFTTDGENHKAGFSARWNVQPDLDPNCVFPIVCGIGTYRNSNNTCTPRQAHSISPAEGTANTIILGCICIPGTHTNVSMGVVTCSLCEVGKFHP